MRWILELLRDSLWCILGVDPDFDPAGKNPVSRIPWQISAAFCFVAPLVILLFGGLFWLFADLIQANL